MLLLSVAVGRAAVAGFLLRVLRLGLQLDRQEFEEARTALGEYLAMHDDEGAAYRLLAQARERLGRADDARDAYRRGIEAATRHGHASMVDEYTIKLEDLDD